MRTAARGNPVGDDEHDAGDREGDERGEEQILRDPVQARPQERRREDACETGLAGDVEAPGALNSE